MGWFLATALAAMAAVLSATKLGMWPAAATVLAGLVVSALTHRLAPPVGPRGILVAGCAYLTVGSAVGLLAGSHWSTWLWVMPAAVGTGQVLTAGALSRTWGVAAGAVAGLALASVQPPSWVTILIGAAALLSTWASPELRTVGARSRVGWAWTTVEACFGAAAWAAFLLPSAQMVSPTAMALLAAVACVLGWVTMREGNQPVVVSGALAALGIATTGAALGAGILSLLLAVGAAGIGSNALFRRVHCAGLAMAAGFATAAVATLPIAGAVSGWFVDLTPTFTGPLVGLVPVVVGTTVLLFLD